MRLRKASKYSVGKYSSQSKNRFSRSNSHVLIFRNLSATGIPPYVFELCLHGCLKIQSGSPLKLDTCATASGEDTLVDVSDVARGRFAAGLPDPIAYICRGLLGFPPCAVVSGG
jgi:hypothetical protein